MSLRKTLIATVGATVLLSVLVSAASAGRYSTSSQTLRATYSGLGFGGPFGIARCPVTLEGSLHSRTIAKTSNALIGYVTRAMTGRCQSGSATVLAGTLPWHARYGSFTGTLPDTLRIDVYVVGAGFQIREPVTGVICLALTAERAEERAIISFNRETGSGVLESALLVGEIETSCHVTGDVNGLSTNLTALNSSNRVTVTLI